MSCTSTSPFISRNAFVVRLRIAKLQTISSHDLCLSLQQDVNGHKKTQTSPLQGLLAVDLALCSVRLLTAYCSNRVPKLTFLIQFGTFSKEVFWACVESVPVEIMRLKKSCPEFPFCHVMWNIFCIFHFHCEQTSNDYKVFCKSSYSILF